MAVIGTTLSKVHGKRWQILAGTTALGALSLVTAGVDISEAAAVSADDAPGGTALVECRSGTITEGDVQTSSMSLTVVDAAHVPELPGGCSVTP